MVLNWESDAGLIPGRSDLIYPDWFDFDLICINWFALNWLDLH